MSGKNRTPDFSGEDFTSCNESYCNGLPRKEYITMLDRVVYLLHERFAVQPAGTPDLTSFVMFNEYNTAGVKFWGGAVDTRRIKLFLVSYYSSYSTGRFSNAGTDEYLFGYFTISKQFPKTLIHPEMVSHKMEDLLLKRDVDFTHCKKFSRRFQVLTENRKALEDLFLCLPLDNLAAFPDMEIELGNGACVFRCSRKNVSIAEAENFCQLTERLLKLF